MATKKWVVDHINDKFYGPLTPVRAKEVAKMLRVVCSNREQERCYVGVWSHDPSTVTWIYGGKTQKRYNKRKPESINADYNKAIKLSARLPKKGEVILLYIDGASSFAMVEYVSADHRRYTRMLTVGPLYGEEKIMPMAELATPSVTAMKRFIHGVSTHIVRCNKMVDIMKKECERRKK